MGWLREKQATWGDAHVGAFVYDKTGKPWKVTEVAATGHGGFLLHDKDGMAAVVHPSISAPVDALVDEDARAVHALSTILGGVVIG